MTSNVDRPTLKIKGTLALALAVITEHPQWYVFPITRYQKFPPCFENNLALASNDPKQIEAWHRKWPACNWGITLAKSRLIVVDVDEKEGKHGRDTYVGLDLDHGFPDTLTVRTPSGGHHYYFQIPADDTEHKHRLALGKNGFGRDVDVPNYVLIPGCRISGGTYTVERDIAVALTPDWFWDKLAKRVELERVEQTAVVELDSKSNIEWAINYLQFDAPPSIEGSGGEKTLLDVAAVLKDHGISEEMAVELLDEHYNCSPTCDPVWLVGEGPDADRLDVKVHNAYTFLTENAPGSATAEHDFGNDPLPPMTAADLAANQKHRADKEAQAETPVERPQVEIKNSDLPRVARKIKRILIAHTASKKCAPADMLFTRPGGTTGHLSRNKLKPGEAHDDEFHVADDLVVVPLNPYWIADLCERVMEFFHIVKDKPAPCNVPNFLIQRVLAITTDKNFPSLLGTVETPTLRRDGSVLDKPGYDKRSGLYFDPGRTEFPKINPKPTRADAEAALKMLCDILADFPFHDDENEPEGLSKSVALAMLLTAVVRRSLPLAPGFGADANEAQSGKTTLMQTASIFATGRKAAERPWSGDEQELRKALGSALASGDAVLLYDNVDDKTPLESPSFAGAFTSELFKDRLLGRNDGVEVMRPTNVLMLWSGNHLTARGDMAEGRVLMTQIIPSTAITERTFTHYSIEDHVIANRPALVVAALTVLRAYLVCGERREPIKFRFKEWADLVAASLMWLGLPNPCDAMARMQAADPEREHQGDLVRAWAANFGEDYVSANEMLDIDVIRDAVAGLSGVEPRRLIAVTVTAALKNMEGLTRFGYKVHRVPGVARHGTRYRLEHKSGDVIARQTRAKTNEIFEATEGDDFGI